MKFWHGNCDYLRGQTENQCWSRGNKMTKKTQNHVNLLAELTEDEQKILLDMASIEKLKRKEVLYLPGDPRENIYLVLEGVVKLARLSEDGREIIIDTCERGEMFGELALINQEEHETMAETMTPAKVAVIHSEDFESIIEKLPKISFILARIVGLRRMILESKLEDLAFRNVPSRLTKFLMEQALAFGTRIGNYINVPAHYSQQEIGSMIGSTRETTSHFLNDFRRNGLIDFNKKHISILDPEALSDIGGVYN
jgi:CRP/FNR family cyclic AMP-dependent transcriptional regulator